MTRNALPRPPILLITDRRMTERPLADVVMQAVDGGCRWILVREKDLGDDKLASLVTEIAALVRPCGAFISVSGSAAVAQKSGARGVHLPHAAAGHAAIATARIHLGSSALVGVSTHSVDEARAAGENGADYVTLSPVFLTASKPGYGPPLGLEGLAEATAQVPIPVLALAGIDPTNAGGCRAAGAAGIAMMGSVMRAANPAATMADAIGAWGA